MKRQVWYNLKSKDGSIDMLFTDYGSMMNFYKNLSNDHLDCSWDIVEVFI